MLGILLIDKPLGCTSHDVVNILRRRFNTKRVGHAGTLDPLATGLLVIAVGPATRFLQYLPLEPKEYEGDITFGRATSTYDSEGETTSESAIPLDLDQRVEEARGKFLGLIEQLPPMHSAVKVAGKPLYKYARAGQTAAREPRTVHVDTFDLTPQSSGVYEAHIVCSGGTYVRSLANDIGEATECGAFLSRLRRTRVGRFHLGQALSLDDVSEANVIPLTEALPPVPLVPLQTAQVRAIREGRAVISSETHNQPFVALLDERGDVFSVARAHGNLLQPECVIPTEALDGTL
jgi:tRNA pseudouridine55 synthase